MACSEEAEGTVEVSAGNAPFERERERERYILYIMCIKLSAIHTTHVQCICICGYM